MKLNKITKHEACKIGFLKRHTGPHTGELVCVDTMCKRKKKHIKWISSYEQQQIERILKNEN